MPTRIEIENAIRILLAKYHAEYAILFGSYARGEETPSSDVDVIVFGGANFKKVNIFAFAEDLCSMTGKEVDAFEICEIKPESPFYHTVMKEGVKIA